MATGPGPCSEIITNGTRSIERATRLSFLATAVVRRNLEFRLHGFNRYCLIQEPGAEV